MALNNFWGYIASKIGLLPDGPGKSLRTIEIQDIDNIGTAAAWNASVNVKEQQVVAIGDPRIATSVAPVDPLQGLYVKEMGDLTEVMRGVLRELTCIRLTLTEAYDISITPSSLADADPDTDDLASDPAPN